MGLFIQLFKFRQQKAAEKLFTALLCRQYMGAALPVYDRRVVPSFAFALEEATLLDTASSS